ncbi:MAG TPA: helix-turn-helix transcriptional regulator [Herpetosiphonaceae bacterium]
MFSSLAELVTQRRTALGYTMRSLAARVGVSSAYIAHIEHGRITMLTPQVRSALARELHVSEETLLRVSGYSRPLMKPDDPVTPVKSLALLVKQAREARGLTQAQVDEAIGMSTGYTGMVESGRITRPRQETLRKLELVLGIPREDMLVATGEDTTIFLQKLEVMRERQKRTVVIPERQKRTVVIPEQQRIAAVPEQQRLETWSRLPESLRSAVLVLAGFLLCWLIRGHRPRTVSFDRTP